MKKQINKLEWKEIELNKLGSIIMGQSPKGESYNKEKKGVPLLNGAADFKDNKIVPKQYTTHPTKLSKKGDILFCIRATIGKTIISDKEYCLGRGVAGFRGDETNLDKNFLLKILDSKLNRIVLQGSTIMGLKAKDLESLKIPLPPLETQKKIVKILEKVEQLKDNRQRTIEYLDDYLKSVFNEMFGKLKLQEFSDEILEIIDGDRGVNYPHGDDFSDEGYCLFLNTGNVRKDGFNFDNLMFITKEKDEQLRKGKVKINDVILTTRGTVGNVAYYHNKVKFDNIRINSGMVLLRSNSNYLLPYFLFYLIQMPIIQNQFLSMNSGSAQPQLPITNLKKIKIPLPPLEHQQKFASIFDHVKSLKEKQTKSLDEIETLFNSLIQKYYRVSL